MDDLIDKLKESEKKTEYKGPTEREREWMEQQDRENKIGTLIDIEFGDYNTEPQNPIDPSLLEELKAISSDLQNAKVTINSDQHVPGYIGNLDPNQKSR